MMEEDVKIEELYEKLNEYNKEVLKTTKERDQLREELDSLIDLKNYKRFLCLIDAVREMPDLVDALTTNHIKKTCNDSNLGNKYCCLRCNLIANLRDKSFITDLDSCDFELKLSEQW